MAMIITCMCVASQKVKLEEDIAGKKTIPTVYTDGNIPKFQEGMIDASNEPDLLIILTTCKISKICQFESKIIPYKLDALDIDNRSCSVFQALNNLDRRYVYVKVRSIYAQQNQ